jgi:nitronate monooxygenase
LPSLDQGLDGGLQTVAGSLRCAATSDDGRDTNLNQEEILSFLNEMLEAERAGSRVTLQTVRETTDVKIQEIVGAVQLDEARWCSMLLAMIRDLGGTPSSQTGTFYQKAIAITDVPARLAFLNKGQGWVVRKLRETIPKITDDEMRRKLEVMLISHEENIEKVNSSGLVG